MKQEYGGTSGEEGTVQLCGTFVGGRMKVLQGSLVII